MLGHMAVSLEMSKLPKNAKNPIICHLKERCAGNLALMYKKVPKICLFFVNILFELPIEFPIGLKVQYSHVFPYCNTERSNTHPHGPDWLPMSELLNKPR